jgi:hypothetical protein
MEPYLHRLRGDILLKHDPANPAPAEGAYRTAIATAKQQGARSYELLASLSLAKLDQSTGHPAEAFAVLAPALEGFSPTPRCRRSSKRKRCWQRWQQTSPTPQTFADRPINYIRSGT